MRRRVVLVTGPPCAGKTTLVTARAHPDDYVLDADVIARSLGSPAKWKHPQEYRDLAESAMLDGIDYIAEADDEQAWVIRSVPNPDDRHALAEYLRADEVLVLLPPYNVLMERCRRRAPGTRRVIDQWFARYAHAPSDTLITTH